MKRVLKEKFKDRSGESIVETLVALLIAALALTMLALAIATSSNLVNTSRKKLKKYYSDANALADFTSASSVENGITFSGVSGISDFSKSYNVKYNRNDGFSKTPVIAYKKAS